MNLKIYKMKLKNYKHFNSSLFTAQRYFFNDGTQLLINISTALFYFKKTR